MHEAMIPLGIAFALFYAVLNDFRFSRRLDAQKEAIELLHSRLCSVEDARGGHGCECTGSGSGPTSKGGDDA